MKTLLTQLPAAALLLLSGTAAAASGGEGAIPWMSLGLHAFNLTLLLGVIAFFFGGKIRDSVKDRSTEVKRDIDESNRLRKEARERFEELEWRLAGFEEKLAAMKAEAAEEAEEERAGIIERAGREALRVQEAAQRTIQSETAKASMVLRKQAVKLAVELAEQRLAANVGPQDDSRLANEFFNEVDAEATHV